MTQEQREWAARVLENLSPNDIEYSDLRGNFFPDGIDEAIQLAINALREQGWVRTSCGEKAKACEYCNDTDEQVNLFEENNYAPYSGMESAISINRRQDGRHIVCVDLWKDGNLVAEFEIFYCPMCGRKLESE